MKLSSKVYSINTGHVKAADCLDASSISFAMATGRKKAYQYLDALRKYLPSIFESAHITITAPFFEDSETRRIIKKYTVTSQDYINRCNSNDEIGRNCYHIDLYDNSMFYGNYVKNGGFNEYKTGESHGIPYRYLIPKSTDNILVAGRSVSCERAVLSSMRIIQVCFVTEEAAGTAASIMIEDNCALYNVSIEKLKTLLNRS